MGRIGRFSLYLTCCVGESRSLYTFFCSFSPSNNYQKCYNTILALVSVEYVKEPSLLLP